MRKTLTLLTLFRSLALMAALVTYGAVTVAYAQQSRVLPANGKRGTTGESLPLPQVKINRQALALAPGGLIFDTHNRTILHQNLPQGADVWYQFNIEGQVQHIYILRPDEQARLKR